MKESLEEMTRRLAMELDNPERWRYYNGKRYPKDVYEKARKDPKWVDENKVKNE